MYVGYPTIPEAMLELTHEEKKLREFRSRKVAKVFLRPVGVHPFRLTF